jgi:hypothetical protein
MVLAINSDCFLWESAERFQSLTSDLISPGIGINSEQEADKAARDFTASIASEFRLSASEVTISDFFLDSIVCQKHKQRLGKLWQETRDSACKTADNWVKKTIRKMTRRHEIPPQATWPVVRSPIKRDEPKAPAAIHSPLGLKY